MSAFLTKFGESEFISFLRNEGIEVKTNTKARGNLGICFKNRIDISKKAKPERRLAILAHEYAHKIHYEIEKEALKQGGSLEKVFNTDEVEVIKRELVRVTHFVDENSLFLEYHSRKDKIKEEIKYYDDLVKQEYPDFKRSCEFIPIKKYFRKNNLNAKYLLRHDHVKLISPIFRKEELISINTVDEDFPQIPEAFRNYLKLLSFQRKQRKLSARKNKLNKYYLRPTELFARFIEGFFIDKEKIKLIAPVTYKRFEVLLYKDYYGNLKTLLRKACVV